MQITFDLVKQVTPPTYEEFKALYLDEIEKDGLSEEEVKKSWDQFMGKTRMSWMADFNGKTVVEGWIFNNTDDPGDIAYKILTDVCAVIERETEVKIINTPKGSK